LLPDPQITRKELFEIWRSKRPKDRLAQVTECVQQKLAINNSKGEDFVRVKRIVKAECENFRQKWNKTGRRYNTFLKYYNSWLNTEIEFRILPKRSSTSVGRPQKSFGDSSSKTKHRKIQALLKLYSSDEICVAAEASLRASGKRDRAKLIRKITTSSPRQVVKYKKCFYKPQMQQKPYRSDEALALFISNKMTVHQYKTIQQEAKNRGFNLYPCYEMVLKEKQKCYPSVENITVTDISAEVNLQALLDHTASRLCCYVIPEVFERLDENQANCTIVYKWGCDGSSGHSIYKQKFNDPKRTDEFLFVISLVPIRVLTENGSVIWQNPRPCSPRLCRIIKFVYEKESEQLIKEECRLMTSKIELLTPTVIIIKNRSYSIKHNMILCMIDGKVCNVLSETKSTQRCFICKASSTDMNKDKIFEPDTKMYEFGISPLHCYIRSLECFLNISYRSEIKTWQVRGKENKTKFEDKKKDIIRKFKEIGLIIDKVKVGYGTSNDGNTARRFFNDYDRSAFITGLNKDLLYRFHVILRTISIGLEIDIQKFRQYCFDTRKLYLELYPWFNMPMTVHKILTHGADIAEHCILPLGQMSEEASEAKNKEMRKVREGYTCKKSRHRTNYDVMRYMLAASDPHITFLRHLGQLRKGAANKDVLSLLKS